MEDKNEINSLFKCSICGTIIERVNNIDSKLFCCNQEMNKLEEKTEESKIEKHVPFIEQIAENEIKIRIGENQAHPMTEEHYIQFIELITKDNQILRKNLQPTDNPEAIFNIKLEEILYVREYCNLHGLWRN